MMPNIFERLLNRIRGKNDSPLAELHPELQSRVPIMRVFSDEVLSYSQLYYDIGVRDYGRHPWVHKAIKVIADNMASLRLEVVRIDGDEKEPLPNHILNEILQRPNPTMAPADLWRQWVIDMMLGGEEGHEIVRNAVGSRILEIWPREPTIFSVQPGKGGRRYAEVAGYKIDDKQGPEYILKPNQFIHYKFYNPGNPWRGIAPINAVRMSITIDQLAQAWSRLFFKNQARPDFAVIAPEGLTASEKTEIENRLQKEFGDPEGWHKPIVLEQGVTDVKALSFPPKDLTWLEQRKFSRDEVGAIFGVPDEILGYGRDTYENFGKAMRVLWTLTLVPLIDFRDTVFSSWARQHNILKPDERIETDLTDIPELQEDKKEKVLQYTQLVGYGVPLNLANQLVGLDLPPIEGGDTGYLPISYVPVTSFKQPPKGKSGGAIAKGIPEYGSEKHQQIMKRNEARIAPLKEKMKRDLKKFWQQQQNEVSRRLRASRSFGKGKFVKQGTPPVDQLFDLEEEIKRFIKMFGPVILGAIEMVGSDELLALGLEMGFDITRPEVQAAFQGILQAQARRTQDRIWLELIDLFQEAEAAGESLPEIVERLSAFYGDLKSEYQIERIARTTMTGASNAGAVEAWEQSGVVSQRGWISALIPGRTRDEHRDAHGQIVGLHEAFMVGGEALMYPGDPNGSPGNIINCLCATYPIVRE
jgi:HK97 family phage portal protein